MPKAIQRHESHCLKQHFFTSGVIEADLLLLLKKSLSLGLQNGQSSRRRLASKEPLPLEMVGVIYFMPSHSRRL
jgi:hypothetical protein